MTTTLINRIHEVLDDLRYPRAPLLHYNLLLECVAELEKLSILNGEMEDELNKDR